MRVVNAFIVLLLLALPIAWMAVISLSLYQAMTSVYAHADRTALHVAFGQ